MANPEHEEILDGIDKLSVCLYRSGISVFALSLIALSAILASNNPSVIDYYPIILLIIGISAALSGGSIHVYSKMVRVVINWSAWVGLILMVSDPTQLRTWLSLGFIFVTFSGIALKESFCFKVVGLKLIPVLLIAATLSILLKQQIVSSIILAISGLIMGYLSIAKWRMPLHFDIGIKANYEV